MRGFRFQLKKELRVGLRPASAPMRNSGALTESMNIRVTEEGVEGYVPPLAPLPEILDGGDLPLNHSIDWPFPQVFLGTSYIFVGHRRGIDIGYWDGTVLRGSNFVTHTDGLIGPLYGRWPWTFMELPGGFFCFCSGDSLLFYIPDPAGVSFFGQYQVNEGAVGAGIEDYWDPSGFGQWGNPLAVCFFRGQVFLASNRAYDIFSVNDVECRSVRWSSIGEFKYLGIKDGSGTYDYAVIPDAGQLIVPGHREVRILRVLPLRDHVIAYCSNCIVAMTPRVDPTPAYQIRTLAPVGIAGVYAVAGGEDYHVFVDRTGNLWTIDNELKLNKVGHQDLFKELQGHRSNYTNAGGISAPAWNEDPAQYYYAGDLVTSPIDGLVYICKVYHVSFTAPDKSWCPGDEVHPAYTYDGITYATVWQLYTSATGADYAQSRSQLHMVYNPVEDEVYVSDGIRSFIFSSNKALTETSRCVTSMFDVRNSFVEWYQTIDSHSVGIWKDTGERWAYFVTDILNMNNNMIKTIESVDLDGDLPDDCVAEVCCYWRENRKAAWKQTGWTRINPKGVGTPMVSAVEFRVCVRVRPFDGFLVDCISIGWKQSDRSQIRGAYAVANEASANSGG